MCLDREAQVWEELARWGEATQMLTAAQVRLARQLRELAETAWEKAPTAALTKRAIFLLDAAESHIGAIDDFHFVDESTDGLAPTPRD